MPLTNARLCISSHLRNDPLSLNLKNHLQSFLHGERQNLKRHKSGDGARRDTGESGADCSDSERRSRATTPGKSLLGEVSLKPPSERNIKNRLEPSESKEGKCEFKNHFKDFMKTPAAVRRGRSFSQSRDKDKGSGKEDKERTQKPHKEVLQRKALLIYW